MVLSSGLPKHFIHYAWFTPKNILLPLLALALLCRPGLALGQGRSLIPVTAQQFPAGLPKLTDGAQAWGDYDKDGKPDLIIIGNTADAGGISKLYRNTGSGFDDVSTVIPSLPGLSNGTVNWIDYDNDNWPDLFFTGWTDRGAISQLYRNDHNGHFDNFTGVLLLGLPGLSHSAVTWADYDGDQTPDLLVSGWTGTDNGEGTLSRLYLQKKDHSGFTENTTYFHDLPQVGNGALSSADFNKDNIPDLFIAGDAGGTPVRKLYISSRRGIYIDAALAIPNVPGLSQAVMATGDYDGDGLPDLMLSGASSAGRVSKLYHNGKFGWNNFEEINTNFPGVKLSKVAWADYNNDKRPDLMLTGQDDNGKPISRLYHNWPDGFDDVSPALPALSPVYGAMVAWGDYDHDGWADLFISGDQGTGADNYATTLYHNSKNGTFLPVVNAFPDLIPSAYGVASWVDMNKGGLLDLLYTGLHHEHSGRTIDVSLYGNKGGGNFINQTNPVWAVSHGFGDWTDFDRDGVPDLILAGNPIGCGPCYYGKNPPGQTDDISIGLFQGYLERDDGKDYYRLRDVSTSMLPNDAPKLRDGSMAWGDYNGDGWPDMIITGNSDFTANTRLYLNNNGKGFIDDTHRLHHLPGGLQHSSVAWGDYDGDGRLDLVITGQRLPDGKLFSVLYHNTDSGFEDASDLLPTLPGLYHGSVAWADYDGDGLLDLLVTGETAQGVAVTKLFRNKGMKVLFDEASNALPNLPSFVNGTADWVDYDKDGRLDLLLTGDTGNGFDTKLYHNTQSGFADVSSQVPGLSKVALSATAWGDYDGDGYMDLLLTGKTEYGGPVGVLYHNASLDATTLLPGLPNLANSSVAWGDYDSDGRLDLMVTGATDLTHGTSKLYRNTGNGFEDKSTLLPNLPQVGYSAVAWGDYDGDDRLDLMLTGSTNGLNAVSKLYRNTGNGFVDASSLLPALPQVRLGTVAWTDYNNDGKLDLLITGTAGGHGVTKLYRNTGNNFVDVTTLLPGVSGLASSAVAFGDYDGDGRVDMLLTASGASKLYRNTGNGFEDKSPLLPGLPGVSFGAVAWGDYDSDGQLDLLITGTSGQNAVTKLYHNTGVGFEDASAQLPNLSSLANSSAVWADVDNNGYADLLLTGTASNGLLSKLYLSSGSGFTETSNLLPDLLPVDLGAVAWADYDNDGRLDLLLTGQTPSGYHSRLYHNLVAPANTPPSAPTGLNSNTDPNQPWEHLIWRRASDAQTPQAGLSYNLYVSEEPDNSSVVDVVGAMADYATGYRRVVRLGNAQDTSYLLTGLTPGKTYYWSVQAIDGAFAGGPFAPEQSFVAGGFGEAETSVSGFTLVNTSTDKDIQALKDGDVLDLTQLPRAGLNIRANTAPKKVGSVVFALSGQQSRKHTENGAPYALFKNLNGNYFGGDLQPGDYTLTATPYSKADGKGAKGTPLTVHFRIMYPAAVTTFTLVNAQTGKDIQELKEGDVLNLSTLVTTKLSIRATTSPDTVGRVAMALSGQQTHSQVENILPYALFGGNPYDPWTPEAGSYTLSATPYSAPRSGGAKGQAYTIHFTVMNNAASVTMAGKNGQMPFYAKEKKPAGLSASPNPFSSQTTVRFSVPVTGYAALSLYDANGREVRRLYQGQAEGGRQYQVSLQSQGLPAGIYAIRLVAGTFTTTLKVVAR